MNTCGTCAYFGEEYTQSTWKENADGDFLENVEAKYHTCTLIRHINDYSLSISKQEVAGVVDGSGYAASFCVTDEFGCNQWMPK
jgi:hypothetical protein